MAIRKFGQYVHVNIRNSDGEVIFETDGLKIDFDVMDIEDFSRAKITLTNLAPATTKAIGSYNDVYISLKVSLHDGRLYNLVNNMYISNTLEEKVLPESLYHIYAYSNIRKQFLERQVDLTVPRKSLRNTILSVLDSAGYDGGFEFTHFPESVVNYVPIRPNSKKQGSLQDVLKAMGNENRFKVFTDSNGYVLRFLYMPTYDNVRQCDLYDTSLPSITLSTDEMRSNPKLGPSNLSIVSNLNPNIKPTSVLDISQLLTAGTSISDEDLQVAENILKDSVSGHSRYQTHGVRHSGSNWANIWNTSCMAYSPTPGTSASNDPTNWWKSRMQGTI